MTLTSVPALAVDREPLTDPAARTNRSAKSAGGYTLAVVMFLGLGGILPALLVAAYPLREHSGLLVAGQLAILVYSALRLSTLVGSGILRPFTTIFWGFVYSLFGVAQAVQLGVGDNPFHIPVTDELAERQIVVVLLGCVAFDIAQAVARARGADVPPAPRRVMSRQRALTAGWVSVAAFPVFLGWAGGWAAQFQSRQAVTSALALGAQADKSLTVLQQAFATAVPAVALYSLVQLRRARTLRLREVNVWPVVVLLVAENLVLNNPISQPRFWIATLLFAFIFTAVRRPRQRTIFTIVGLFLISASVLFPYLDAFRYNLGTVEQQRQGITSFYTQKTDYGTNVDLINTIAYVDSRGHSDGRQFMGAALSFVPRKVWANKPRDTAYLLATFINYPNLNLDSPLWAEGYIDFGIPGTIVLLGLYGLITARLEGSRWSLVRNETPSWARLAVPLLAGYSLIILRGSLLQASGRLFVFLLLFAAVTMPRRDADAEDRPAASLRG